MRVQDLENEEDYCKMVDYLAKDGDVIAEETTREQWKMLGSVRKLAGIADKIFHKAGLRRPAIENPLPGEEPGGLCHDYHMASALWGEVGEVYDAIKRHVVYQIDLDEISDKHPISLRGNIREEFGDVLFYVVGLLIRRDHESGRNYRLLLADLLFEMNQLAGMLDVSLQECLNKNRVKLAKRYPEGYSDKSAKERADK